MRRRCVLGGLGLFALNLSLGVRPLWAKTPSISTTKTQDLIAAWKNIQTGQYEVGVLRARAVDGGALHLVPSLAMQWAFALPSRPHGVSVLADGSCLVAARRPGDWLIRVGAKGQLVARTWLADDRRLNGHVLLGSGGGCCYTSETDLDSGAGLVVVRDPNTLQALEEWPTHGVDPHEMLYLPAGALGIERACVLVANGGVKSLPALGRQSLAAIGEKEVLKSSVVALDALDGRLLHTWALADPWLSLRHMSYHARLDAVGVAIQAHHPDSVEKSTAPVLAVLNRQGLLCGSSGADFSGYGGDVACHENGFLVSCTQSNRLAEFDMKAQCVRQYPVNAPCALVDEPERGTQAAVWVGSAEASHGLDVELDNHWVLQPLSV